MPLDLQGELNRLAGTTGLSEQGAANAWAGTFGVGLREALRTKATARGVNVPRGTPVQGVLNAIAGTSGFGPAYAASLITNGTAPTVRATSSAGTTSLVASLNVTLPASIQAGDLIIVMGNTKANATWTTPAGYSVGTLNATSTAQHQMFFYKTAVGGDASATVTMTPSVANNAITVLAVVITAGTWDTTNTFDPALPAATTFNTSAATVSTTSVTTVKANTLIVMHASQGKANTTTQTFTTPSGWTSSVSQFGHNATDGLLSTCYTRLQPAAGVSDSPGVASSGSSAGQCTVLGVKGFGT